jgi:hypothetical protein
LISINKKDALDAPAGAHPDPSTLGPLDRPPEPVYSVAQVAEIFDVTKQTVYKWLIMEDGDSVIPPEGWFKLPGSGHIRIKRAAVLALQGE